MAGIASGINHVAVLSRDLEALAAFYEDVFGAAVIGRYDYPTLQHWFIEVGPGLVLHAFSAEAIDLDGPGGRIFERGRIDHFAIELPDRESFDVVRQRLVERGASDGEVTDFKALITVSFDDPDGRGLEICWQRPGMALSHAEDPASMTSV